MRTMAPIVTATRETVSSRSRISITLPLIYEFDRTEGFCPNLCTEPPRSAVP
jgi:hypothetical protein